MKRHILFASLLFLFSACDSRWPDEEKKLFRESCLEDAHDRGLSEYQAQDVCDCRLERLMKKYPDVKDALENMQSIVNDPEIKACDGEISEEE